MVDSVDNMVGSRSWVWGLIVFLMVANMIQLGWAVFATSAMDPQRMTKIYGGLASAGLNTVVNSAVICSMFGIYYDAELGMPVVNYMPGWAYVNTLMVIFAIIASLSLKDTLIPTVALPGLLGLLAFYLVFWLMIPLGYGHEHLSVPRSTRVHSAPLAPLGSSLLRVPHRQPRV